MLLLLFETELPPTEDEPLSVELLTLFPAVAVPCKKKNTTPSPSPSPLHILWNRPQLQMFHDLLAR